MEIKKILVKPFTEEEKKDFIVTQNYANGYEIRETEKMLEAWGKTQEEIEQEEYEMLQMLSMTKLDFVTELEKLGITYEQVKTLISSSIEAQKQWELCERVYRFNPLLDVYSKHLGITSTQLDEIFKAKGV